jgi:hypothetical protein
MEIKLDYEKMGSEYSRDTEMFRVIEALIDQNRKLVECVTVLADLMEDPIHDQYKIIERINEILKEFP